MVKMIYWASIELN